MSDAPRVALVTGASRGIGAAVAKRLQADGFDVFGSATSASGAQTIDDTLGQAGHGLVMRLEDQDSISAAYAQISAAAAMPSVLVNNAGITADNLLMRMSDDDWLRVIDTNVNGLFRVTKPVLRNMMKQRWGRIINISSVVARMGNPGQSNYVASKSGIEGFTRSLAIEVATRGITVNSVAPGFIESDMTAQLTSDQTEQMLARIPAGRMGEGSDVAGAVAYLASDVASYVTGATIPVNGGMSMS